MVDLFLRTAVGDPDGGQSVQSFSNAITRARAKVQHIKQGP